MFYVYLHCKPDGTPFYVGKGCGRRAYDFTKNQRKNEKHQKMVEIYGRENIIVKIQMCCDEQEAFEQEVICIQYLRDAGFDLCNKSNGGTGPSGAKFSEESKQKMRKPKSEEHKAAMRKPKSKEHIANRSAARLSNGAGKPAGSKNKKKMTPNPSWLNFNNPETQRKAILSRCGYYKRKSV